MKAERPRRRPWPSRMLWSSLGRLLWILARLRFLPFSAAFVLLGAAVRFLQLRYARRIGFCARLGGIGKATVPGLLLAIDREREELTPAPLDCHFRFGESPDGPMLHDLFSVLLLIPDVRSISFYFPNDAFGDDEPFLRSRAERARGPVAELGAERSSGAVRLGPLALPAAANRDAETLLKRIFGAAVVVSDNTPPQETPLVQAILEAHPSVRFVHLNRTVPLREQDIALGSWGFTLFERLAIIRSSDCYIGPCDEHGTAAALFRMPRIMVGTDGDSAVTVEGGPEACVINGLAPSDIRQEAIAYVGRLNETKSKA